MTKRHYLNTPERVAAAVRSARREQGLSQIELAEISGVGRRFVQELERGHPRAEIGKVLDVLDALGISTYALPSTPSHQRRAHIDLKAAVNRHV